MPQVRKKEPSGSSQSATVGYEAQLWQMADALRGSMDAAQYKLQLIVHHGAGSGTLDARAAHGIGNT